MFLNEILFIFKSIIMKFKIVFILTFACIIHLNCKEEFVKPSTNPTPPVTNIESDTNSFAYLALGDSYTIGQSVDEKDRFPVQLLDRLFPNNLENKEVKIIARTGWRTDQLQTAIDADTELKSKYDLVSLLIGVNNQYQGGDIEIYKVEFRALLEKAISLAGNDKTKVFVVSIPDYAYTPFGNGNTAISQEIDAYNAINKEITESLNITYHDITPISREGLNDPTLVADDNLHPSGKQYTKWVEVIMD